MAQTAKKQTSSGKKSSKTPTMVTPIGKVDRFAYIYQPDSESQFKDNKYKLTLLIPNEKADDLKPLMKAILDLAKEEFGAGVKYNDLEVPIKDGSEKADEYDARVKEKGKNEKVGNLDYLRNHMLFQAKTKKQPGIIGPDRKPLGEEDDVQSGDWVRISIVAFTYERTGKVIDKGKMKDAKIPGVGFYLQNIQKVRTGERFGGGPPENDFDEIPLEDTIDESGEIAGFDTSESGIDDEGLM